MAIREASPRRPIRTTVSLPAETLEALDYWIEKGQVVSRAEFIDRATARELARLRDEEIDSLYEEAADDPELAAQDDEIMKAFESADSETARMLDEEHGPWDAASN
jgi:Arc/MetJ-type ribon-helix-helix transcriptional regulator